MKKIFVNGKIRTIDADNRMFEAMAIEDGKITALGTTDEIMEMAGDCQVVDLGGKDVLQAHRFSHPSAGSCNL